MPPATALPPHAPYKAPEWRSFRGLQPYGATLEAMKARAAAIRQSGTAEAIWMLEHEAVYTGGTSAKQQDLLAPGDVPVIEVGRGGQWTWHGPGQRVVYVMLDLTKRGQDVRALVHGLESWIIACLADFGIAGQRRPGLPGIWVARQTDNRLDKIAAIGIRISRWVSWHGLAINLAPDLRAFDAIVPCGVTDGGVTSLCALGQKTSMAALDSALKRHFNRFFPDPLSPPSGIIDSRP